MAGLDSEDGAGGGQVVLIHDVGGGAEVGGHTDALEHRGGGEEGLDVGVGEVVGTGLDGSDLGSYMEEEMWLEHLGLMKCAENGARQYL